MEGETLFLYDLAFHLRLTVQQLLHEMTYEELLGWIEYFDQRPIGWREDQRAAYIMMSFGGSDNVKPEKIFPSLARMYQKQQEHTDALVAKGQVSTQNFMQSSFFAQLLQAKGGDKIDFGEITEGGVSGSS